MGNWQLRSKVALVTNVLFESGNFSWICHRPIGVMSYYWTDVIKFQKWCGSHKHLRISCMQVVQENDSKKIWHLTHVSTFLMSLQWEENIIYNKKMHGQNYIFPNVWHFSILFQTCLYALGISYDFVVCTINGSFGQFHEVGRLYLLGESL